MDPFDLTPTESDDGLDDRWYLCTKCFQRFLWIDLSPRQLCCRRCRLPEKDCAICDKLFEPTRQEEVYCKRCDYFLLQHAVVKPPSIPEKSELQRQLQQRRSHSHSQSMPRSVSVVERWKEIKCAAGLTDDVHLSD